MVSLNKNTTDGTDKFVTTYYMCDPRGNVLAVISDEASDTNEPTVVSLSDYYPFGMTEPGRSWNAGDYRFGYTGHEKENDLAEGVYTTEYRLLDTRLGMVEIESKFFVDLRNYIKNNKKEGTMVPSLEVQVKYEKPNDPNSSTYGGTDKSN